MMPAEPALSPADARLDGSRGPDAGGTRVAGDQRIAPGHGRLSIVDLWCVLGDHDIMRVYGCSQEDTPSWRRRGCFMEPVPDVEHSFRAADPFAPPSVREAHPLGLLEAMACGLPAAATRVGSTTDTAVDDRRNGRSVAPDDEEAPAQAIGDRGGAREPARSRLMGLEARRPVEARCSIRRSAGRWLPAYEAVFSAGPLERTAAGGARRGHERLSRP